MVEFIVVMPRIEGNMDRGFSTVYYSDNRRFTQLRAVKRHGMIDLDQSDDFLIGRVEGDRLLSLQWMDELRDDPDEVADAAESLGLRV